jgi:hypothetical protein
MRTPLQVQQASLPERNGCFCGAEIAPLKQGEFGELKIKSKTFALDIEAIAKNRKDFPSSCSSLASMPTGFGNWTNIRCGPFGRKLSKTDTDQEAPSPAAAKHAAG